MSRSETHSKVYNCDDCLFQQISCQFMEPAQFNMLRKASAQLRFNKGETILKQGAQATHLAFLQKGVVKFQYEDERARNLILTITKAPALIGGSNIFNDSVNFFSVQAVEECEVCMIDMAMLKEIAQMNNRYLMKLLELVTGMFRESVINFITLAHKQVNGRIADVILYLSDSVYNSDLFTLTLTRKELSEFAGCSTENVIHTLSRFHREGILNVKGKSIEIADRERLQKISKIG
ncbi:MAG: Crp/Fnr family transcriptional regulator [Bacteroidetes bacterium]|nr:Crp/Fnr family transcriptional regulator [Bacteroidota bacterium]